ncbi:MAG TPA: hypothetical protein VFM94_03490 [Solirubrobacterales bacterium]|nr:hypothetical protein [Solirubrobacterales bacterium]
MKAHKGLLIFNICLVLVFAGAAAAAAKWTTVRVGNLILKVEGRLSPRAFPRHEYAPASFRTRGQIATVDGAHPPALREATVYIDRNGTFDARGLPVCRAPELEARDTRAAKRACGDAIVGEGEGAAEIAFPEQRPIVVHSPITIFNGGVAGGATTLFLHAFITVPAPAAIVSSFEFTRVKAGRYGMRGVARIPVIAGSSGSLVGFDFKIKRLYGYRGERKSFDLTRCPDGVIKAKGSGVFVDEVVDGVDDGKRTTLSASLSFPCTPKG